MSFWNRVRKLQDDCRPLCTAIVPAAGSSTRMGGENKLLMHIACVPVLTRTLQAIDKAELVTEIVVATRADTLEEVAELVKNAGLRKKVKVVCGGATRTESVLAAAMEADPKSQLLAIHDGARPLVLPEEFDHVIRYACNTYAAAPAIPMTDTVKVADETGLITATPDRSTLFAVQTPQVFQANILKAALQAALQEGVALTDDCAAVERLGKQVYLTQGNRENIKITTPLDITIAEAILMRRELGR